MLNLNKSQLVCKQCDRILHKPVHLPCNCTICHAHLHDALANTKGILQCGTCRVEFAVGNIDFKENEHAKHLLASDEHLSNQGKERKSELHVLIHQYHTLCEQFRQDLRNAESFAHEKFAEIRRQIDLQREALKEKIDEIALDMIDQANSAEAFYRDEVNKRVISIDFNIEHERALLDDQFRRIDLTIGQVEDLKSKSRLQIDEMQAKLKELRRMIQQVDTCGFKAVSNFSAYSFGLLGISRRQPNNIGKVKYQRIYININHKFTPKNI